MHNGLTKITCPYCFERFEAKEVEFRCANRNCALEDDKIKKDTTGIPIKDHHVFTAPETGWSGLLSKPITKARCDKCNVQSTKRLCPKCHFELSHDAGLVDGQIISIIGGRATGKSHYIAALYHQLRETVGKNMNLSVFMVGDYTRDRFLNYYYLPLFSNHTLIEGTLSATVDETVKTPMIFRLKADKGGKSSAVNLCFYDSAGEDMKSLEIMSTEARYITNSSGIIFLLDPLQIPAIRQKLPTEILPHHDVKAEPIYLVERLRELFERSDLEPNKKIKKPVAFVFSKIDALINYQIIDPTSTLRQIGNHFGSYNLTDAQSLHTEVWNYLQTWMASGFTEFVEAYFENFQYFGVSSLGEPPDNNKLDSVSPHRVEDPFLWLLFQYDLIEAKKRR